MNYVSESEYNATLAKTQARIDTQRAARFAGKRERTFTITVRVVPPIYETLCGLSGVREETRKIKGYTLRDAKDRAGIA